MLNLLSGFLHSQALLLDKCHKWIRAGHEFRLRLQTVDRLLESAPRLQSLQAFYRAIKNAWQLRCDDPLEQLAVQVHPIPELMRERNYMGAYLRPSAQIFRVRVVVREQHWHNADLELTRLTVGIAALD